nr:unnamed protein product [Spirometra erinaceieuropaei]
MTFSVKDFEDRCQLTFNGLGAVPVFLCGTSSKVYKSLVNAWKSLVQDRITGKTVAAAHEGSRIATDKVNAAEVPRNHALPVETRRDFSEWSGGDLA